MSGEQWLGRAGLPWGRTGLEPQTLVAPSWAAAQDRSRQGRFPLLGMLTLPPPSPHVFVPLHMSVLAAPSQDTVGRGRASPSPPPHAVTCRGGRGEGFDAWICGEGTVRCCPLTSGQRGPWLSPPCRPRGAQPPGGRSPEPGFQSPAILAVGVWETALDPAVHAYVRPLGA